MTCVQCGLAASNLPETMTVCPACTRREQGIAAAGAVWPPMPTPSAALLMGNMDEEAIKRQRQAGILMDIGAMAAVQAGSGLSHLLPELYGSILLAIVVIGSIYPHFRGSAHWAESKGYPRSTGRIIGLTGWIGPIILALMSDKNKRAL